MDIVVENVTKVFGKQRAVDNLSFTVHTGEVLGFLGPNGAGKTTTMKAIACYISPDKGDIRVGNVSVLESPEQVKACIGYLPERNPLYEDMFVVDYLEFMATLQGVPKKMIRARTKEMIGLCGLAPEHNKKIGELSKGYRQRVGLAQAMIHDPQVLILDEPTSGLDPNQIVEIRALIRSLGKTRTVLLSSHILAEVEATCDRILIINKGKIVAEGTADELRHLLHGGEVLQVTIEGAPIQEMASALESISSVSSVVSLNDGRFEVASHSGDTSRKAIFSMCVEKHWNLLEMVPCGARLEDVFRELTR